MKKTIMICGLAVLVVSMGACKRTLPAKVLTSTVKASNGWWVTLSYKGALVDTVFFMNTYNTSGNTADSMWVDDIGTLDNSVINPPAQPGGNTFLYNLYGIGLASFKAKVGLQYSALTFSAPGGSENEYWTGDTSSSASVSIFNGKILPGASHSNPSGATSDSINFQIVYSKNPLDTFEVAGVSRTGFDEDEQ
jgi:hypothetical protein